MKTKLTTIRQVCFSGIIVRTKSARKNPNTGDENWLLISIIPTKEYNDMYNIKWSSGYYCSQANHHSVKFANDD